MALIKMRPTSPGTRFVVKVDRSHLHKGGPLASLTAKLAELGASRALILVEAYEEKLFLAARNIPHVEVMPVASLDPLSLIKHDKVIATVGALRLLEQRLGGAHE